MKLKLTKNNTIILTSIILVLSIALGFLVWRVNQKETTAPTKSEAEGEGTSCSTGADCTEITCYWPSVSYCHNNACECRLRENQTVNPCTDKDPRCTPPSPGGDYELCHYWDSASQKMITEPGCEDDAPNTKEAVCKTTCSSCNNPYFYQTRYLLIEEEPSCGDGTKDPGEACDPNASPTGCATGSTCTDQCICDVNPFCGDGTKDPGEVCDPNASPTGCATGSTCSAQCICDVNPFCGDGTKDPGEVCDPNASPTGCATGSTCTDNCICDVNPYCGDSKLDTGEECEQGDPTGVLCSWSTCNQTACICLPAGLNISKSVVESCIDEGTENPSSELVYTISVTNTGQGVGSVRQVEDVLDPKVVSAGITPLEITRAGVYSSGKILWSFIPSLDIAPGATEIFSYKLLISKENFGVYNNTVILTPESGDAIQANATIEADCLVTVPQTGIFDSTLGRISVGFILLLIGGVVYNLPSEIFINKFNKNRFKYRVKFENNIWKKN